MTMDYLEAVKLAKEGQERGFDFLYENTYKSKYYLALRYMRNEEAAKDVLQDAYVRAFMKLNTLENPETFSSWLGMIVANTAKNALMKKNPMLFGDVAVDADGEDFEYQIEDESLDTQPETAYTRRETQMLVHELIDGLSEEQRICILMFHIEGASIHEIAQALECSENTVKSRLNYGRKNLKVKAEELKKKGYKLYGIAPLPLFLYLLHAEESCLAADGTLEAAGKLVGEQILPKVSSRTGAAAAGDAAKKTAGAAVKKGILHTTAGKAAAVAIGTCVIGGGALGIWQISQNASGQGAEQTEQEAASSDNKIAEKKDEPEMKELREEEYPSMIEGNLTKEELEYVFAYGPEKLQAGGFTGENDQEKSLVLLALCEGGEDSPVEYYGTNEKWECEYSLDDVNRLFSSFTEYQFAEENDSEEQYGIHVEGDVLSYVPATMSYTASAEITSAAYTEQEMEIEFTYERVSYSGENDQNVKKTALLRPQESGRYRIVSIEETQDGQEVGNTAAGESGTGERPDDAGANGRSKELYQSALQSVQEQKPGFEFTFAGAMAEGYEYFTHDMDGDGIRELIVGAVFPEQAFMLYDCRIFTCVQGENGYQLTSVGEDLATANLYIPASGNGLYTLDMSRGTGQTYVDRVTLRGGGLDRTSEYQFVMGDAQNEQFNAENTEAPWRQIGDLSGLEME